MSRFTTLYRGETNLGFIAHRKRWYAASGVIILICIISFIVRGFNFGIDFAGGTSYTINAAGNHLTSSQVSSAFERFGATPQQAPEFVGSGSSASVIVNFGTQSAQKTDTLPRQIASALHISFKDISVSTIGSSWGHDTTVSAIEGLLIFLVVVSIYIAIRFQWRMAVGAMVALIHDIVVAAGIYSLVGFTVTPSTIVGLLTILGFSLYDTVVVFDKVGENSKDILAGSRTTFSEAANKAVNQTLMRSINTSLIALLPVAGLLFVGAGILGVGEIEDLALILFVGLLSGAYSSLFIATPVVVDLTERDPKYKALTRRVLSKRTEESQRIREAALAGVALPPTRSGGPAPAPKAGARPQRRRKS